MEITANSKNSPHTGKANYPIPETLKEFVVKFGEPVVTIALQNAMIGGVQSILRKNLDKTPEEQQKAVDEYVFGARKRQPKRTALEKASASIADLDEASKSQLLALLKAQLKKKAE